MAVALVPAAAGGIGVQPLDRAPLDPLVEAGDAGGRAADPVVEDQLRRASPRTASIHAAIRGSARREPE